jgi:Ricin-type beta-trefoil lectin domain/Domain of unknown function (DUF4476)
MPTSIRARSMLLAVVVMTALGGARAQAQGRPPGWRGRPPESRMGLPMGTGRLRNEAQGMCLDVAGWATHGNANVVLWECNDDPDQVWSFTPSGELHSALAGTCLDAAGYDGAQGANVDTFRCEGLDDQRWTLVPRGPEVFELHNLKRGVCLDVNGKAGGRGDNVMLWKCLGEPDQMWRWEPHAVDGRPRRPPRPMDPRPVPGEMQVPPPPPPTQAYQREARHRARPMDDEPFRMLVATVRNERVPQSQLGLIELAAGRNYFSVGQLGSLISLLAYSPTKLRALEIGAPRLVDPENAFGLLEAFTFSGDKEQAKQILHRAGI